MHPSGLSDEHAAIVRQRCIVTDDVSERAQPAAPQMDSLSHLGELEWVPEENEIACGSGRRERVCKGKLAGLIDD